MPMETILANRGITKDLFNLDESVIEDYNNYDNMQKGIDLLLKHINKKNKIVIVTDADVDGYVSGAMTYKYIKEVFNYENLHFKIHTGKQHGLSKDIVIDDDTNLIILPDSSSNDYKQHKYYKDKNIDILVIDHHDAEYESKDAVVINNQLSKNVKNKNACGASVVYKFLKALDDYLFNDKADDFYDILALGNTADVMDLNEKETRYYVYKGLATINNTFLKALIDISSFQLEGKYNVNKLGWVIAPKLNGTIRSATFQLKEDMFRAFVSDDYDFCLKIANECTSAKKTQDSTVKTALGRIEKLIKQNKNDKCLILEVSRTLNHNHTGLVANKLQDKYGVPTLLFRGKEGRINIVGGSGRGNNNITKEFKKDLSDSGLFEMVEGHEGAFGFEIKKDNIKELKKYLNDLYNDKEIISGKTHEIDLILNEDTLNYDIINEIAQYEDEWGNGIPEPLILFEDMTLNIIDENIKGARSKTMIFEINEIKFIKKFLSNVIKDSFLDKGELKVNIIGKCVNNFYNGNTYSQVEIVDIEIIE